MIFYKQLRNKIILFHHRLFFIVDSYEKNDVILKEFFIVTEYSLNKMSGLIEDKFFHLSVTPSLFSSTQGCICSSTLPKM